MVRLIGTISLVLALLSVTLLVLMRFSDGPVGMLSGGEFRTGQAQLSIDDWSFLEGRETIEFQTSSPATSRTIWLVVLDGRLYFVSGYMNTTLGKLWKQWPAYVAQDNAILIRVDGAIYPQRLDRLTYQPQVPAVMRKFAAKYGLGSTDTSDANVYAMLEAGEAWLFEVVMP